MKHFLRAFFFLSSFLVFFSANSQPCTIVANPATPICPGSSTILTCNGTGGFVWLPTTTLSSSTTNPVTASPTVTTTYSVTATGCTGTGTIVITVNPKPTITFNFAPNTLQCAGTPINFTPTVTGCVGPYAYSWSFGGQGTSSLSNPSFSFTNNTCANQTYNVQAIVTCANGCKDTVVNPVNVKFASTPVVTDVDPFSPFSNCDNQPSAGNPNFDLTINNNTPGSGCVSNYSVNWGDATIQNGLTSGSFPLSHQYTQLGAFNLIITATSSNGCSSTSTTNVANQSNPAAGVSSLGSTNGCGPLTLKFVMSPSYTANSPGTYYEWDFGDGSPIISWDYNQPYINDTIIHTYTTTSCGLPGNSFTVSLTAFNLCDNTPATVSNIKVFTRPFASFTPSPNPQCVGSSVAMINTTLPGSYGPSCSTATTYTWDFGDPASGAANTSSATSPSHTYNTVGTYTIIMTATNPCGTTNDTNTVCIVEPPTSSFTLGSYLCTPASITTTNTSTGAGCSSLSYAWYVDNIFYSSATNPTINISTSGSHTIRLDVNNGPCAIVSSSQTITLPAPPTASVSSVSGACGSVTVTPNAFVTTGGVATTYNWTFTNGTPASFVGANPPAVIFNSSGSISLTVTNSCGTATSSTAISVYPIPTVNAGLDDTICSGLSTTLTAGAANGTPSYSYTWTPTGTLTNPFSSSTSASPNSTTTYTVNVSDANGCTATDNVVVTVNTSPVINVVGAPNSICVGGGNIVITASGASAYSWSPSTGLNQTTGASVTATPTVTTTYTVQGSSGSGCGGVGTFVANVYPNPTITVTPNPVTICIGNSSSLTANSALATSFTWTPATGLSATNSQTVNASPIDNTTYTVVGTTSNGCSGSATAVVNVTSLPNITATALPTTICNGQSTTLTGNGASGGTYTWTPVTGLSISTGTPITANPTTTTTYTVVGSLGGNCTGSATVVVTVNPLPNVQVNPMVDNICIGESATFTASGANSYSWSPSTSLTPTTGANVTSTVITSITYTVTGTGANGCTANATASVIVNPKPILTINPNAPAVCANQSVPITAFGASTYIWKPSTGLSASTGSSVTANPTITTTYTLIGTTASGCKDSITFTVLVIGLPNVIATAAPYTICNTSTTTLTAIGAATYTWTPSTGLNSSTGTSVITSPASTTTYTVTGTVGTCSDDDTVVVNILPLPNLVIANSDLCIGDTATLNIAGAISYVWSPSATLNASTGNTVLAHPTFSTTYTVTATGANGCTTTSNPIVTIHPLPVISFSQDPVSICLNSSTNITASGASTYQWSPAIGLNQTTGSFVNISSPVNTTYTIIGTTIWGCIDTTTLSVTVNTNVVGSATDYQLCNGESSNLSSVNASTYTWSPSAGLNTTVGPNVIASPNTTTTYTVTGSTSSGCFTTDTVVIIVNPLPNVTLVPGNIIQCSGDTINFVAAGANTYSWSPAAGLSSTSGSLVIGTPSISTTYTVLGTDINGCTGSATSIVGAYPLPSINAGNDLTLCNTPVTFTLSGFTPQGGVWSGFGISDPVNAVFDPWLAGLGIHVVYYDIINANGCTNKDSIQITVTPVNFPVCGAPDTVCFFDPNFYLTTASPAGGVWTGFGVINNASGLFNPTLAGPGIHPVIYTIGFGQCTRSDTSYVYVRSAPVLSIAPVVPSVCIGSSINLSVSGAQTYTWSPVATLSSLTGATVTALPTVTTTYTINAVDQFGCTSTLPIQVIVHPLPIINAGTNQTLCSYDDPTFIFNFTPFGGTWTGIGIVDGFTGEFSPQVSGPGSFTINYTATDIYGCSGEDSMIITVINPTASNAGNDISVCVNVAPFNLTGFSPANGTWTGTGIANSSAGTFNPALAGVGQFKLFYAPPATLCSYSDSILVTVLPTPTVNLIAADNTICNGQSTNLTAAGGNTFIWSPSSSLSSSSGANVIATPTSTTTYTVITTDANNCSISTTIPVLINPLPIITINPVAPAICIGQTANLTASGATTYTWSPSTLLNTTTGNTVTASPLTLITYTVTGTDNNGCINTDDVIVTVNQLPNITLSENDPWICNGSSTQLNASGAANYTWTPFSSLSSLNGAQVTASPTITTTYSVVGTDANGCQDQDTISVTVYPPPITFNLQPEICFWDTVTLIASGCVSYAWTPGGGLNVSTGSTVIAQPFSSVTYTVVGTDIHGCTGSNTVSVVVHDPAIIVAPDSTVLCLGEQENLIASGTTSYLWFPSTGLSSSSTASVIANPTLTTTYTVIGTDIYGCKDTTFVPVMVFPEPIAQFILSPPQGCDSLLVQFTNLSIDATQYLWTFSDGTTDTSTNPFHWFSGPGNYDVTLYVEGLGGCNDTLSLTDAITVYPEPVADFAWRQSNYPVLNGEVVFDNNSINSDTYDWNFGDSTQHSSAENPSHIYEQYGTYWVTLVSSNTDGCVDTISKPIKVEFFKGLYVPNAMTPEYGDVANRVFTPKGFNIKSYRIQIFDTWGNILWQSSKLTDKGEPAESWDGYYKGVLLQQDSYVWKVDAVFLDDSVWPGQLYPSGEIKPTGTVTILR
jgi:PKD repeat protein